MHSYGIAHRDIKLENILMVESSDDSELKLVDFGLSKILGPNETTNDPFGTLVIFVLILILFYSHMWHLKFCFKKHMVKMLIYGVLVL